MFIFTDNTKGSSLFAHKFIIPCEIVNRHIIISMKSAETFLPANNRNHFKI